MLLPFYRLIAGMIDRDINITIFIQVLAQRFKRMYFSFEIAWGMDIFEGKNKQYCKRLTKFGRNKVLRIKSRAAMFVWGLQTISLARYLTNPRVIAWLLALKCAFDPRLLMEILLFWATLNNYYCGNIYFLSQILYTTWENFTVISWPKCRRHLGCRFWVTS